MPKNKDSMRHKLRKGLKKVLVVNAFKRKASTNSISVPETVSDELSTCDALKLEDENVNDDDEHTVHEYLTQREGKGQEPSKRISVYSESSVGFDDSAHDTSLNGAYRFAEEYIALIGDIGDFKGYSHYNIEDKTSEKPIGTPRRSQTALVSSAMDAEEQPVLSRPELKRDGSYGYFTESISTAMDTRHDSAYESWSNQRSSTVEDADGVCSTTAGSALPVPRVGRYKSYGYLSPYEQPDTGYGSYGDRSLSAEEEIEEDIQVTKDELRFTKQATLSSTRNILHHSQKAYQTGSSTLANLSQQSERLQQTEAAFDHAEWQNRKAKFQLKQLERYNGLGGMFYTGHVQNPFAHDPKLGHAKNHDHDDETKQSDFIRARAWKNALHSPSLPSTPVQPHHHFHAHIDPSVHRRSPLPRPHSHHERSMFQFEPASEDEMMEEEIDGNLDDAVKGMGDLKGIAIAMNEEVDGQNDMLRRIEEKADRVDDGVAVTLGRMERIR
ncbi:hypothetical protein BDV96DRAFT_647634 [Lophiotrema nucula]|uniref:t-SNARE coiled-coil homology domain-containing protein n=1 Tax=Lophiotrema nucula TaxID=690887 RepID=A0A6A5Z4Y0_9PLEO|nr:hypothetical protein BDV96DRAFT_647634 [Lophiotrema nucula]